MTTAEIRTKLIEERTKYLSDLANSDAACKEVAEILKTLDDETIAVANSYGFDLEKFKSMDLEKLKVDQEYVEQIKSELDSIAENIHKFLEEQLSDS